MLSFLRGNLWLVLVAGALVTAGFMLVDPAPPRELTLATGQANGAYHAFAVRLAEKLAEQGLTLHLRSTQGSVENLSLLRDPASGVAMALIQSGVPAEDENDLHSLGSLFYEPLWVFARRGTNLASLRDLQGKSVAVGAEGSGTLPVALRVLEANGLLSTSDSPVSIERIGGNDAVAALRAGRVDAALFVGSPNGELIRGLVHDRALQFHGLNRPRAYQFAFPNLATLTIGEGQLDLATNIPASEQVLLASVVSLVVNDEFHPGLTPAVLEAATSLLRTGGPLETPGEFPNARPTDFALLAEADHYHKYGPPFLMRYLPFWVATVAFRVFILSVPLIALLIPLIRVAPPLYQWRTRRRIFRWYSHLREVDQRLCSGSIGSALEEEIARLHQLQDEILTVKVPLSYSDELYDLHLHIDWLIRRLERARTGALPEPSPK